jgi:CheY-like chemotaxis protein
MMAGRTVLVAEDDAGQILLLQRAFLKAGINVSVDFVKDGQETIDYLKREATYGDRAAHPFPELLLLDLNMPRVDGFGVLEWVREQPGLKRLLVVVLTTSNANEDVNRAYDLGANSYLVKPAGPSGLVELAETIKAYWLSVNQPPDWVAHG